MVKPRFDRFDICEAYFCVELDFQKDGVLRERSSCRRRRSSIEWQLSNMGFVPAASLQAQALTPNGHRIYRALVSRLGLDAGFADTEVNEVGR